VFVQTDEQNDKCQQHQCTWQRTQWPSRL